MYIEITLRLGSLWWVHVHLIQMWVKYTQL